MDLRENVQLGFGEGRAGARGRPPTLSVAPLPAYGTADAAPLAAAARKLSRALLDNAGHVVLQDVTRVAFIGDPSADAEDYHYVADEEEEDEPAAMLDSLARLASDNVARESRRRKNEKQTPQQKRDAVLHRWGQLRQHSILSKVASTVPSTGSSTACTHCRNPLPVIAVACSECSGAGCGTAALSCPKCDRKHHRLLWHSRTIARTGSTPASFTSPARDGLKLSPNHFVAVSLPPAATDGATTVSVFQEGEKWKCRSSRSLLRIMCADTVCSAFPRAYGASRLLNCSVCSPAAADRPSSILHALWRTQLVPLSCWRRG